MAASLALGLAAAGLGLQRLASGLSQVAFNERLLAVAPEHLRATFLSAANTLWSALSLAAFPVLGRVGDVYGLEWLFAAIGLLHVLGALVLLSSKLEPVISGPHPTR